MTDFKLSLLTLLLVVISKEGQCVDTISAVNETNASAEKPASDLLTIVNQLQDCQYEQDKIIKVLLKSHEKQAEDKAILQKQVQELRLEIKRLQEDVILLNRMSRKATVADFTAYPSVAMNYSPGTIIQFGETITNTGGFFNPDTGIFTCPVNGLYHFFLTIYTGDNINIGASIYFDGSRMIDMYSSSIGGNHGVTSLVLECNMFQGVWVECVDNGGTIQNDRLSSFSGFLLVEYTS